MTGCAVLGCRKHVPCPDHGAQRARVQRSAFDRGYDKRWQRTSRAHLRKYPRCGDRPPDAPQTADSECQAQGRVVAATVTDHIVPHRGNARLLWASSNRQSLCATCHGKKSARERLSAASGRRRSDDRGALSPIEDGKGRGPQNLGGEAAGDARVPPV